MFARLRKSEAHLASAGNRVHYERRCPEQSVLYQLVQEQLETFLAHVEGETGATLPEFIKQEFDAFLEWCKRCGIRPFCSNRALMPNDARL